MYGSVRSELMRQKSQNSISTGRPRCLSIRSGATLIQAISRGNGGAGMVSGLARTDVTVTSRRVDLWSRLADVHSRWNVLDHPFYVRWSRGELTATDLALYAGQYRHAVVALAQ